MRPFFPSLRARTDGRSPVRDGLVLGAVLAVVLSFVHGWLTAAPGLPGSDLTLYQREVQAWLAGAPMYPPSEVQGPFPMVAGAILYPPITILAFAPTLLLPLPLWWLIPLSILGAVLWRLRPSGRWFIAIAFCLAYPVSVDLVISGNPDIWLVAALAVAVYWRPAAAFVLLKPSLFPLALVGIKSRGWWALTGVFAIASLVLLPQTLDWLAVVRHGNEGGLSYRGPALLYSLQDLPLLAVALLAWAGSSRRRNSIERHEAAEATLSRRPGLAR